MGKMSQPEHSGRGTVDLPCCFYEEIPAMAHSIDTTGRLVRVSNLWLETLGYERSEVIGRKSVEFLTEESRRHAEESALPEYFRTGQCRDVPYQFVTKGGEVIDVLLSATCERDSDHRIVSSCAILVDVTERNLAAEHLEKQTLHMASFPQLNPNPVLEADLTGRVTFCNPAVLSTLAGLGMGESDAALFLPEDLESILEKWDGESRLIVNREVLLGSRSFAEVVHVVPEFDVVRIYAHDISERKAAEEELLRHRDHLDLLVRERTEELDRRNAQLSFEIAERKRAEEELRRYARRIMEVEESMRRNLAAELHDEIGRDLTALGINCTIISDSLPEEARNNIGARIEDSRRLIEEVTRAVRNIMARLRPPMLDDYGLPAALRWYADLVSKRSGIAVTVTTDKEFPGVSEVKEMILFRIAQEALTNIVKHSGARNALITLSVRDGVVRLAVSDDGKGLDTEQSSPPQPTSGWGLRLMRERVELFGGSFRIDTGPGRGTRLEVEIRED